MKHLVAKQLSNYKVIAAPLLCGALLLTNTSVHAEWSSRGNFAVELQGFTDRALHYATQSSNASVSGTAEFGHSIGDNGYLTISPFFRIDQHDSQRTHVDLREFIFNYSQETWEVNVGIGKVFWGVAESNNLVDVINQNDFVEGGGAEHKLGQAMVNLLLLKDWGEISLFALPRFREMTFAGQNGRPRGFYVIDTNDTQYESDREKNNIDLAARVSGSYNEWDLGAHLFHGTARAPAILPATGTPYYYQISQAGIDAQATFESWLLKSEAIYQTGDFIEDNVQLVNGIEYSFYSVAESSLDIGIVAEWLYDSRGENALSTFQNDALLALRFALNDEQSSQALIGLITDLDNGGDIINIEASRRLGDDFRMKLNSVVWANTSEDRFLSQLAREDFIQLSLEYFF